MSEPATALAEDWITRLVKLGTGVWVKRRAELDRIFNEFGDYQRLAETYIEPDCRTGNPADLPEDEPTPTWAHPVPIRKWVNDFLSREFTLRDGRNTLFVLSDAGMGKSSLLTMLKLTHLLRFWPSGLDFVLLKLGPESLVERLTAHEFGGRSLLNRNSEREYRFAHYSIEEFLVARLGMDRERLHPRLQGA